MQGFLLMQEYWGNNKPTNPWGPIEMGLATQLWVATPLGLRTTARDTFCVSHQDFGRQESEM